MWGFNPVWLMRWHISLTEMLLGDLALTGFPQTEKPEPGGGVSAVKGRGSTRPSDHIWSAAAACAGRQRGAARRRQQRAYSSVDWAPQAETCQFRASVSWDRLGLLSYNPPPTLPLSSAQKVFLPPRAIVFLGKVWKLGLERWAHMTFFN